MCGGHCVCRAPPSVWIWMFWFSRDVSEWRVGVFPPANESAQVRLREDKKQRLDAVQMDVVLKKRKYSPMRRNIKRIKLGSERE